MIVFCCYFVDKIGNEETGIYDDFHLLDQLGVYTKPNSAYKALVDWARRLWGRNYVIKEDEESARVFVASREYCVGIIEVHQD